MWWGQPLLAISIHDRNLYPTILKASHALDGNRCLIASTIFFKDATERALSGERVPDGRVDEHERGIVPTGTYTT